MVKLFAYYRVSTDKQKMGSQKMAVREWIKTLDDTEIVEEFQDDHISGSIRERKGLNELLSRLKECDGVVVFDETRLTRDFEYGIQLMFLFEREKKKYYIASKKEIKEFSELNNQLIHAIQTYVAAEEKNKFVTRIKAGIRRRQSQGLHFGRPWNKIKWNKFHTLRQLMSNNNRLNKSSCIRILQIGHSTFYTKYREHIQNCEICQKQDPKFYSLVQQKINDDNKLLEVDELV